MGISFAKSIKVGAVRFNFSGSGIGVSVGIPGLRIGTGPRGAYISGGVAGFRYRKSIGPSRPAGRSRVADVSIPAGAPEMALADNANIVSTVAHETKDVLELRDSSSDALLQSMNEQRGKSPIWPFIGVISAVLFLAMFNLGAQWHPAVHIAIFAALAGLTLWVRWRDKLRKLTVLFYEPDASASQRFEALVSGLQGAATARMLRSIANTSQYRDTKYSAGASEGVKFAGAALILGQAPGIVANIEVPLLQAGRTTLAFYPDRILAFQGHAVGSINYSSLQATSVTTRFIEHNSVPSDARVVDRTWQYVNKKGGPDRRFKDNRELPICAYNQFNLSTQDGLDLRFMGSKEGGFDELARAIGVAGAPP